MCASLFRMALFYANWEECHCNYIGKKRYSSISAGLASYPLIRHDRLVKKAFTHASSVNTLWWQNLSLWLSQHGFEGVLAEGTFSLANAEQHLRDKCYHGICQSSATKVSFFMNNMSFDSNVMASYLRDIRPSASLFSLIKFRLGGHSLRVETDRWLRHKPPREQRVCRHCSMQAVEDEQHFLFDLPFLQHH